MSSESGAAASGASVQEGGDTPVAECQGLILGTNEIRNVKNPNMDMQYAVVSLVKIFLKCKNK